MMPFMSRWRARGRGYDLTQPLKASGSPTWVVVPFTAHGEIYEGFLVQWRIGDLPIESLFSLLDFGVLHIHSLSPISIQVTLYWNYMWPDYYFNEICKHHNDLVIFSVSFPLFQNRNWGKNYWGCLQKFHKGDGFYKIEYCRLLRLKHQIHEASFWVSL